MEIQQAIAMKMCAVGHFLQHISVIALFLPLLFSSTHLIFRRFFSFYLISHPLPSLRAVPFSQTFFTFIFFMQFIIPTAWN